MSNKTGGCARPTGATVGEPPVENHHDEILHEEPKMPMAKVGTKAPDFQAPAISPSSERPKCQRSLPITKSYKN